MAIILWHTVERRNRNLENQVQNVPWMPHVLLLQFRFFVLSLWYFKLNCIVNYLWFFIFYRMVGTCLVYKFKSSTVEYVDKKQVMWKCTLFWSKLSQPGKITLQVSVLIIKYLVAVSYGYVNISCIFEFWKVVSMCGKRACRLKGGLLILCKKNIF